ncbi:hypothetical protein DE146DRAFT_631714 [Phaeosphaeria sp. MPI-PUGE-AT-0046c]|nr:hypothetical protein DE146DRAFT_631714 [Phaeosphaeria sp. MPI-PUGE-AT-0046c]
MRDSLHQLISRIRHSRIHTNPYNRRGKGQRSHDLLASAADQIEGYKPVSWGIHSSSDSGYEGSPNVSPHNTPQHGFSSQRNDLHLQSAVRLPYIERPQLTELIFESPLEEITDTGPQKIEGVFIGYENRKAGRTEATAQIAPAVSGVNAPSPILSSQSLSDCGSSGTRDLAEASINEVSVSNVAKKLGALELTDECPATTTQISLVKGRKLAVDILEWVDATKGLEFEPLTPVGAHSYNTPGSSDGHVRTPSTAVEPKCATKVSTIELMHLLTQCCQDEEPYISDLANQRAYHDESVTDAGGTDSTQSDSRSGSARSGRSSTQSGSNTIPQSVLTPYKRLDNGEPPAKKSGDGQHPKTCDMPAEPAFKSQMPCPMPESVGCMGTNSTISELLRSLQNRHRIIICTECCTKLDVPEQERKPESLLKRHASTGCDRICIGRECSGINQPLAPYHRKTERCSNWKAIPKEVRWSFIWGLLNPGLEPPTPQFISSVGYEHANVRTPCRDRSSRDRGLQLCKSVMEDLDTKNDRLKSLEHELKAAKQDILLKQQKSDDKIANLENIIESLLERLVDKNVEIPLSLQKRLARECPGCVTPLTLSKLQMPPTPASTPTRQIAINLPENSAGSGGVLSAPSHEIPTTTTTGSQQMEKFFPELSTQSGSSHALIGEAASKELSFDDFLNMALIQSPGLETQDSTWPSALDNDGNVLPG